MSFVAIASRDPLPGAAFGDRVVAEALTWVGTPFDWQGQLKQRGCDCKGLLAGVAGALGRPEADSLEALAGDYGEGSFTEARLRAGLVRLFDRVAGEHCSGDIALIRVFGRAQHLGILAPVPGEPWRVIETMARGPGMVVARRLDSDRVAGIWRWRDLSPAERGDHG